MALWNRADTGYSDEQQNFRRLVHLFPEPQHSPARQAQADGGSAVTIMGRIIGIFDTLAEAQQAVVQLTAASVDRQQLSIIGSGNKAATPESRLKKSILWGSSLGAVVALLLPHGGILYLAGHLARTAAIHLLGATAKGILAGAAAGGTVDLLRRAGLDQPTAQTAAAIVAAGHYALVLDSDWMTVQHARRALGSSQWQPDARLVAMVQRYGYEYQSFVLLYGGTQVWWSADPEAAVVYHRIGRAVVVGAAPLTARENLAEVLHRFLAWCRQENLDCLMLPIGAETADIAQSCGMGLLRIGESGYFNLPEWKPTGDKARKVRAGVNQARKAGITVERYDPARPGADQTRAEIEALCQQWISTREVDALGWLLELDPFRLSEHKRYFLARSASGQLEGLLACCPVPARRGWYLEDLIRRPDTERGVSELLVVEALKYLAAEGAELATLGTSPLAGIKPEGQFKNLARLLGLVYEHLDTFYHFKALHRFKAKFAPSFTDPEYVAIWPPHIRLRLVLAVIKAFDPGGMTGVMASKLKKVWQEARREKKNQVAQPKQSAGED